MQATGNIMLRRRYGCAGWIPGYHRYQGRYMIVLTLPRIPLLLDHQEDCRICILVLLSHATVILVMAASFVNNTIHLRPLERCPQQYEQVTINDSYQVYIITCSSRN